MENMPNGINSTVAIIVIHVVIGLLQWVARRLSGLNNTGTYGMYITLLPIGFICFGFDIPVLMVGGMALLGQSLVIWGFRKTAMDSTPQSNEPIEQT